MDRRVFTRRLSAAALATGVLVAVALGQLFGAPWGLAAITGLRRGPPCSACPSAQETGCSARGRGRGDPAHWVGAMFVGHFVATFPALTLSAFLELSWAIKATIQLLLLLSGLAALMFGYIARMLEPLDAAEDASGGSLSSATPRPADQRRGS